MSGFRSHRYLTTDFNLSQAVRLLDISDVQHDLTANAVSGRIRGHVGFDKRQLATADAAAHS
jgi:hypothetical protein